MSSIPLAASLVLLSLCLTQLRSSEVLVHPLNGDVVFGSDHELQVKNRKYTVKKVFFSVRSVALVIICDRSKFILWRDSISERDYRRLLYFLRGSLG